MTPRNQDLEAQAEAVAGEVEIIPDSDLEIVEQAIRGSRDAQLQTVDPQEAADAIVARILAQERIEDVMAPQQTTGARELVGVPLEFIGVQWLNSKYEQGAGVYALAQARRLDDGEAVLVTTSARNALAQLYQCVRLGAFPQRGRFVEGSETSQGFRPMWIEGIGGDQTTDALPSGEAA